MSEAINRTVDAGHAARFSVMNTEAEGPILGDEENSRIIAEQNLDREPTLEINKMLRHSQEIVKRNPAVGSTNRFLVDKRQKDNIIVPPHTRTSSSFTYDNYQKPK